MKKVFPFIAILGLVIIIVISILTALGGQINSTVNTINDVLTDVNASTNFNSNYYTPPVSNYNKNIASSPAPVSSPVKQYTPTGKASKTIQQATTPPGPSESIPVKASPATKMRANSASSNNPVISTSQPANNTGPGLPVQLFQGPDRENYKQFNENSIKLASAEPVSTFSLDVDTASYSNLRRFINNGQLPPKDAVRLEELINYFNYNYEAPQNRERPFKPTVHVFPTPWNPDTKIMHIGIKGFEYSNELRPKLNLTFLVDVSGSMDCPDKLPLVKETLKILVDKLNGNDVISIVTYAGSSGVVLQPTSGNEKSKIKWVIDSLGAGGSTAGAEGIKTAYQLAQQNFDKEGINRVILTTDGDFNIGVSDPRRLKGLIERKRDSGIYLSVLGYGQGNYNDHMMQNLAQNGNGIAAYIDNIEEAYKVFDQNMSKNMLPIANDVKVQVEFNPAKVAEYRLIGYETRILKEQDFNNDKIDAGDIGAGHSVTAIYEITEPGSKARLIDDRRYNKPAFAFNHTSDEYAFVKIRYKLPGHLFSRLINYPVTANNETEDIYNIHNDIIFSTSVAGFGQLVKQSGFIKNFTYDDAIKLATRSKGEDKYNYRGEFIKLAQRAKYLQES